MSANEWEVVTKSKKARNLEKKTEEYIEKKKEASQLQRLEEIMPQQHYEFINELSARSSRVRVNSGSTTSTKSKSPLKRDQKKSKQTAAKQKHKEDIKKQQQAATQKPKNMEIALQRLTITDFQAQIAQLKLTYPGSELLWLRGVASYLNAALPFECDPLFSGKSINYPSCLLAINLKNEIMTFLHEVGVINLEYFFHTLLVSLATELAKNLPVFGYKLLLQLIGLEWPEICANNLAKTALLRNSYQNRANICLSILWAVGQGGYKHLQTGIKVWQNIMLPLLELKNYAKFVSEYIERILKTAHDQTLTMNQQEFLTTFNTLKNTNNMPKEHQEPLLRSADLFLKAYINSCTKHGNLFLILLRRIEDAKLHSIELDGCINCIKRSAECLKIWKMNYKKQLIPSSLLLDRMFENAEEEVDSLYYMPTFQQFLKEVNALNMEHIRRHNCQHNENLQKWQTLIKNGQEKSAHQQKKLKSSDSKSGSCCKWFWGSFLLLALIGAVLVYDTNVNGKGVFAKSTAGKVLKDAGMLPFVEKTWNTSMGAAARAYKWAELNVPPYAKPALQLACDLFKLLRNLFFNVCSTLKQFAQQKLPVAGEFVDQYVPGLSQKIADTTFTLKNIVVDVYDKIIIFFQTQVFVGRLSPKNLSNALNQTQNAAVGYLNIFHKKVDAYAKLK